MIAKTEETEKDICPVCDKALLSSKLCYKCEDRDTDACKECPMYDYKHCVCGYDE